MCSEMTPGQITVVSRYLCEEGIDYDAQIKICIDAADEQVEDYDYRIIRILAEVGGLDIPQIIAEQPVIQEYLSKCEEEV